MIETLIDLFYHHCKNFAKSDDLVRCLDDKALSISTDEVLSAVESIAGALLSFGVQIGDKVALLSENRPEWLLSDYAILLSGGITVPIYPTLNPREIEYILRDSEAKLIILSSVKQLERIKGILPNLSMKLIIITMDDIDGNNQILSLRELILKGNFYLKDNPDAIISIRRIIKKDDVASIIYTSGTTGEPKGVMLTHSNFVSNVLASIEVVPIIDSDIALSFLPLSHCFERVVCYCLFHKGATIAFAQSNETLTKNMEEIKPTLMAAVPRLYEKLYSRVMEQAATSSSVKKWLIHFSVRSAINYAERKENGLTFLDRLSRWLGGIFVFRKIRKKLGGRLKFFLSGGAPLAPELSRFFYGIEIPIFEGYGLTETTPVIAVNNLEKLKFGSVGKPLKGISVRISDDGEILVKGPNVMKGYYKKPDDTASIISDSWLATGDIGYIDDDGYLYITDRKKEILITAGGKNVAPQPIENELKMNKYVSQAVLIGDKKPYISALIYPNWENVIRYIKTKEVEEENRNNLVSHPFVIHLFDNVLERINENLSRFEQIKKCRLLVNELSQENGELTPTLKVKRRIILQRYGNLIKDMYGEDK